MIRSSATSIHTVSWQDPGIPAIKQDKFSAKVLHPLLVVPTSNQLTKCGCFDLLLL